MTATCLQTGPRIFAHIPRVCFRLCCGPCQGPAGAGGGGGGGDSRFQQQQQQQQQHHHHHHQRQQREQELAAALAATSVLRVCRQLLCARVGVPQLRRVPLISRLQPRCQLLLLPLLQVRALQAAREDAGRATPDAHVLSQRLRQV